MARTQKNKATAQHLGLLKARLAKLRRELIAPKGGGGATGDGKSYKVALLMLRNCVKTTILPNYSGANYATNLTAMIY